MGEESKKSLADALKRNIDNARAKAGKVVEVGLDKLKDGSAAATEVAAKVGKVGYEVVKEGSSALVEGAVTAKHALDEKTRASLDRAQEAAKTNARKNVERLRKTHPDSNPSEILNLLEEDLGSAELEATGDTGTFISAAAMYIFSAFEINGENIESPQLAQKLIDAVSIADHEITKNVVQVGGAAIAIAAMTSKQLGPVGKVAATVAGLGAQASTKFALITSISSLAGIKNPGKKSVTWVICAATRKILGEPPQTWTHPEVPGD